MKFEKPTCKKLYIPSYINQVLCTHLIVLLKLGKKKKLKKPRNLKLNAWWLEMSNGIEGGFGVSRAAPFWIELLVKKERTKKSQVGCM